MKTIKNRSVLIFAMAFVVAFSLFAAAAVNYGQYTLAAGTAGAILLLLIGSLIMISLGIIGYYIARIYEEIKGRPRYIIEEYLG